MKNSGNGGLHILLM